MKPDTYMLGGMITLALGIAHNNLVLIALGLFFGVIGWVGGRLD